MNIASNNTAVSQMRAGRQRVPKISLANKLLILSYAPCICWFGYLSSTLVFERLYLVILGFAFLVSLFQGRASFRLTPTHNILFFWFIWAGLTAIFAISTQLALVKLFAFLVRIAAATIILSIIYRHNAYRYLAWSFVLAGIGSGLFCFLLPGAATDLGGRLYGTVANANTFGVQITAGICCSLYLMSTSDKYKWFFMPFFLALTVFFVYLIIGSGSRKAAVGVLLVVGMFGFSTAQQVGLKSKFRAVLVLLVGVIAIIITSFAVLQSSHGDRFLRIYEGFVLGKKDRIEGSEQHRISMYERGWEIGMENPILGIGLDNFRLVSMGQLQGNFNTYAHSNYIEMMVGTGVLGVVIYYYAWIYLLAKSLSRHLRSRVEVQISIILLVIMCAYDFAGVSYYSKVSWVIYALIFAGVYGLRERRMGKG